MSDQFEKPTMRLGVFEDSIQRSGLGLGEQVAFGLAALWALGVIVYLAAAAGPDTGPDPLRRLMALMVIFLPAGLVWLGVLIRRNAQAVIRQGEALQVALDHFRKAQAESAQRSVVSLSASSSTPALPVSPAPGRNVAPRAFGSEARNEGPAVKETQAPGLFDDEEVDISVPIETLIRALHFPETAEDKVGFDALRTALRHHPSAQVVRAAQDMLTLLSQDGIYTDDLIPDRAKPDVWRRFAKGERGRPVSELGGVRDRAALALSARRMREEPIFRDTAHHFLRSFDRTLARIEPEATDAEIARLSDTRSARAFMLIGRVSGLFD